MTAELRKLFESELKDYLKSRFDLGSNVKHLKNEISIRKTKKNESSGYIGFRFLNNAGGYILGAGVDSPELLQFFKEINPPYRSHKPEAVVYAMNTSMENGFKSFSPSMGGTVDLPKNEEDRKQACEWIYTRVRDVYLPRVMNLIELKPETITDIVSFPKYYAYPFLTILYIIKKNNISLSALNIQSILSKKILGSQSFDKNLFHTYL